MRQRCQEMLPARDEFSEAAAEIETNNYKLASEIVNHQIELDELKTELEMVVLRIFSKIQKKILGEERVERLAHGERRKQ